MKEGKTKSGMARQNPAGSSLREKKADRARTISGKEQSLKASRTTVKEKTHTWNKSCKESVKRESELNKMVEAAAIDERQEQKKRSMIRDLLEQLHMRREEEDEARGLIEEMQRNLAEAQSRSYEVERKLDRALWESIGVFEKEIGRPQLIMTKMWQMMQSRDTKNLNLDKDFEEIKSEVKQVGWNESTRTTGFWRQDEDAHQQSLEACAQVARWKA